MTGHSMLKPAAIIQTTPWILVLCLYSPIFYSLYKDRWDTIDYTHAYFILPLSLLIVWLKRHALRQIHLQVSARAEQPAKGVLPASRLRALASYAPGLALLVLGLVMFAFGWRWDYLFISTLSLIPLLFGLCLFLYNKDFARTLAFPILYLLLLVPIPVGVLDGITLPMRYMASVLSAGLLTLMRYDVVREGLLINMAGHEIFMGAPCSGLRSLITMISLSLIYIYFNQGKMAKNIILFLSIIPLAFIGNLTRVIALCLITFYYGEAAGQGFFHNFSGTVVFLIIILGLMRLEKAL
jgi:exosortase